MKGRRQTALVSFKDEQWRQDHDCLVAIRVPKSDDRKVASTAWAEGAHRVFGKPANRPLRHRLRRRAHARRQRPSPKHGLDRQHLPGWWDYQAWRLPAGIGLPSANARPQRPPTVSSNSFGPSQPPAVSNWRSFCSISPHARRLVSSSTLPSI